MVAMGSAMHMEMRGCQSLVIQAEQSELWKALKTLFLLFAGCMVGVFCMQSDGLARKKESSAAAMPRH